MDKSEVAVSFDQAGVVDAITQLDKHFRKTEEVLQMAEVKNASIESSQLQAGRFHFIDGLRGIAAMSVVVFHIWHNAGLRDALLQSCPRLIDQLLSKFGSGVDIFFVISGFVIAHSLRNIRINTRTAANFAFRRQIRLDPTYWVMIVITLLITVAAARKNPVVVHVPSTGVILTNVVYLQGILNEPNVVRVSWTLCLEVQFYLILITIDWISEQFRRKWIIEAIVIAMMAAVSIVWPAFRATSAWFISTWYLFAIGALCYTAFMRRAPTTLFFIVTLTALLLAFIPPFAGKISYVGPISALLVFTVGRCGHLNDWLAGPVLSYFAVISYSLYLVHFDLVSLVFRAGQRMSGPSIISSLIWSFVALALSIAAAHFLWLLVERPSARLATSLKSRPVTVRK